jgi:indolepyruvate ferredoxin oxidoreductase beta subunit
MPTNILLSGVGGQGIITASKVLAEAALLAGCFMKKSEIHGMSQRGGSVESHVRLSRESEVYSPLISAGAADILMAFEALEALRALPMLRPEGVAIVDARQIVPMSVITSDLTYPDDVPARLEASGRRIVLVDGFEIASQLGEQRAANIVMMGAASRFLCEISPDDWTEAIRRCVRPKAQDVNIAAFQAGFQASAIEGTCQTA